MAAESIYSALMEIKDALEESGIHGSGSDDGGNSGGGSSSAGSPVVVEITLNFSGIPTSESFPDSVECNYSPSEIGNLMHDGRIGAYRARMVVNNSMVSEVMENTVIMRSSASAEGTHEVNFMSLAPESVEVFAKCSLDFDLWLINCGSGMSEAYSREDTSVNVWTISQPNQEPSDDDDTDGK